METQAELKRQYKETKPQAGIFQVKNTVNGKVLLGSSTNLHGPLNKHRFMLKIRNHDNKQLQKDWDQLGPDAFVFEILEVVQERTRPRFRSRTSSPCSKRSGKRGSNPGATVAITPKAPGSASSIQSANAKWG